MFIPCLIQGIKKHAASTIVGTSGMLLLMFTPFAYYCFSGLLMLYTLDGIYLLQ